MESQIRVLEKLKFRNPILIEGLPGIGNVGRVAAGYLVSELKMKKFAELYSPHFLPLVLLHEDSATTSLKCEFYYYKSKDRDIIVLTGDTQSITPEGHYEVCEKIADFASKLGVKDMITLGGFAEGKEVAEPRVIGAVNDKKLVKKYGKVVDFTIQHQIGTIVGTTGLLLGIGKLYDIDAICLMGETFGLPVATDPKAANKVLETLLKIIGIKLDLGKLDAIIKEMEDKIKKADDIHKNVLQQISKPAKEEQDYIG